MSALELLFEIGTEELPPGEIVPALQALEAHLVARCRDNRLAIGAVRTYATPRRLAVVVSDVAPRGEDAEELAMGPSAKAAFDADGNPSKAALGFARSRGVDIDAIERVDTPRGEYIAARIRQEGRPAAQVLTEALNAAFAAIPWKRSMRWGWADESFSRPVHWIVALLGGAVLPVSFAGIDAGDLTRGHRFLAPDPLRVTDAAQWQRALLDAKVVVDLDARRDAVREGVRATVTAAGLRPLLDEDLVEEVVHLVEWPVPLLGRFPEELLEVPREVLITSMKTHQRYFAAEDTDGALANAFCFISNMVVPDPAVVVAGNLRVLRARLEDARFFWKEDRRRRLEERVGDLATVRYIDGLGTLRDRADRLVALAGALADTLYPGDGQTATDARRAALLAKADLTTAMVYEFPELQGTMGRYYAAADGESDAVCAAIEEHYMPRGASDAAPRSRAGVVVALADKLDALAGCFALGLIPSGSADPYALRRATIGLLRVAIEHGLRFRPEQLFRQAWAALPAGAIRPEDETIAQLTQFLRERLRALLGEYGTEVATAVVATLDDDIPSLPERARVLRDLRGHDDFDALAAGFKRVVNIVARAEEDGTVITADLRPDLLLEPAEQALAAALTQAQATLAAALPDRDFDTVARTLVQLKQPIDRFFDEVLVNADDAAVRTNRLVLLARLRAAFLAFADISLIG